MLVVTGLVSKELAIRDEVILNGMGQQGQGGAYRPSCISRFYYKCNGNPLDRFN